MNIAGLIIHGTKDGVDNLFVSDNFKEISKNSEIEKTLSDEREFSTRLAKQSHVYSIQLTTNFRVISLIATDVFDFLGRSGFFAIRLYTPKNHPSIDFQALLQQINKRYIELERDGIQRNNQDYSDLLNYELPLAENQQNYLAIKNNDQAFSLYIPNEDNLNSLFNHKAVELFDKVYVFNKERAVSSEIIKSLGLKSFEEAKDYKEIYVNNQYRILKELKVNNNSIEFNRNNSEFTILLRNSDLIEYNTTQEPQFKQANGSIINVAKKYEAPAPPLKPPRGPRKKSFLNEYGVYLLMLVMISVLGFASWYFVFDGDKVLETEVPIGLKDTTINDNPVINDSLKIDFIIDTTAKDSNVYLTNYPKLNKYRFRIDNKKWSYKNTEGKNKYVAFYQSTLNDINKVDSLSFNQDKKNEFLKSLAKMGKQEVLKKKVDSVKTSPANKNAKIEINKDTPKTIKSKENKTTPPQGKTETDLEKAKKLGEKKF
jgi:hypothetical protein